MSSNGRSISTSSSAGATAATERAGPTWMAISGSSAGRVAVVMVAPIFKEEATAHGAQFERRHLMGPVPVGEGGVCHVAEILDAGASTPSGAVG